MAMAKYGFVSFCGTYAYCGCAMGQRGSAGMAALGSLLIETVHPALRAGILSAAVTGRYEGLEAVFEIPGRLESDRIQRDLFTLAIVAVRTGVGARIALEEIIEASVLLNDDDDVVDLARRAPASRLADEGSRSITDFRPAGIRALRRRTQLKIKLRPRRAGKIPAALKAPTVLPWQSSQSAPASLMRCPRRRGRVAKKC